MTLDNTDQFVVSREDSLYAVEAQLLTTQLEDTDLMVVSRSGVPYKATGAEIKDSLGSPSINPGDNDVSLDPAALGGTGTEQDPYILRNGSANPFGGTTETTETISIVGQSPETKVIWTDNSVDAGTRFSQIVGITDASGNWSGKLNYADIPNSTEDTVYVGKLQIGLVHYQWTVNQVNVIEQPTAVNSVNLIEADPTGDRFTSQSFVASSQVVDGVPVSTKTIDAHVDGTLSRQVKFDEPLES